MKNYASTSPPKERSTDDQELEPIDEEKSLALSQGELLYMFE
jgi:hypothetical protein